MPSPLALHDHAVALLVARLRSRGCTVARIAEPGGVELAVTAPRSTVVRTCAVRSSGVHARHQVMHVHGRHYEYRYATLHWNLHHHGKRRAYPDIWLLVCEEGVYVVPGSLLGHRLTYSLLRPSSRGVYRERPALVRNYFERWELLTSTDKARSLEELMAAADRRRDRRGRKAA